MSVGEEQETEAQVEETTPEVEETVEQTEQTEDISGGTEAADESGDADEPSGEPEAEEEDWINEDALAYAESAGLTRGDLDDYGDLHELQRAVRILDRRNYSDRQRQQQPAPEQQQPAPAPQPQEPPKLPPIDREQLDDVVADAIEARDKFYQSQIEELGGHLSQAIGYLQQQEAQVVFGQFDQVMDDLGHDDLFGKTKQLVPGSRQAENRKKVFDAFSFMDGAQPTRQFIQRAVNQEFWSDLNKKAEQTRARKVKKQSRKVLRGGQARTKADGTEEGAESFSVSEAKKKELAAYGHKMMMGD